MDANGAVSDTGKTDYALSVLTDIDAYKNLHKATATLVFVISAAIGVVAFFLTLDLTKWLGVEVEEPWMQISLPYFLTFIVWIIAHFSIQSVLQLLGARDLHALARDRLSKLNLDLAELDQLRRDINGKKLKHRKLFEAVIEDMASRSNP